MSGHWLKRWLYLTHRWIGIVSCLFFAMWFASGLVMVYVPFPALDREEWLEGQAPIAWAEVRTTPAAAFAGSNPAELRRLNLEMRGSEPVWRWQSWDGEDVVRSAVDGRVIPAADGEEARAIAAAYAGMGVTELELIHNDQWTVAGRYEDHRPLWKATIEGDEGRNVYVSSRTGAVVLETTASERFWNWLGAVPHWIYPTVLRQDAEAWRQVIIWLSGPCIIAALTGLWIGILRVRLGRRRFKEGRITPYRGWMMWHHLTGLAGSLFLILWIFSGWLSVDPGHFFRSEGPGVDLQKQYAGAIDPNLDPARLAAALPSAQRITFASAAGTPYLQVEQKGLPVRQLDPRTLAAPAQDPNRIRRAIADLFPQNHIASVETIAKPDAYWYTVNGELPLPVTRIKLDDSAATWIHLDPATGEVLGSMGRSDRIYRWLFDLFHRWDLNILLENRPARNVVIWIFSLLGLATSVTGVWIGWMRLTGRRTGRNGKGRREAISPTNA
jgi:uncharacterized iron-regulated membrane protein